MGAPMQQATLDAVAATGPEYAFGPGYSPEGRQFLPVSLAFSFFVLWIFGGVGSPAGPGAADGLARHADDPPFDRAAELLQHADLSAADGDLHSRRDRFFRSSISRTR